MSKERTFREAEKKALKDNPPGLRKLWSKLRDVVKVSFMTEKPINPELNKCFKDKKINKNPYNPIIEDTFKDFDR